MAEAAPESRRRLGERGRSDKKAGAGRAERLYRAALKQA
jgi:hypothetical protein